MIAYTPKSKDFSDENGTIAIERDFLSSYLDSLVREYGLADDKKFLDWLNASPHPEGSDLKIPSQHDDRARHVAHAAIDKGEAVVTCNKCRTLVDLAKIKRTTWEDTQDAGGIKMGADGILFSCPKNHPLMFVALRIY